MIGTVGVEAGRLWRREYPAFVHDRDAGPPDDGCLPVFAFHTLEPADFGSKLDHLRENGYRTVTLDEALQHVRGERTLGPRAVLLTVDDGRLSTWSVGFPLLRRRGMHAVAFLIPGFLREGPRRPTLDEGDATGGSGDALHEARDLRTVLRWSEAEELHRSEAVDVQSHTWTHRRVTVSRRLRGFVTPDDNLPPYDLPCPAAAATPDQSRAPFRSPGAPVFEHAPILSVTEAVEPPQELVRACVRHVREEGGRGFFRRSGWRRELGRIVRDHGEGFRTVELEPHQRRELVAAREALGQRLGGARIRHLCLPSGRGSEQGLRLARATGHDAVFWSHRPGEGCNRPGSDPFRIARLKHDYLWRLPGDGRRSLLRVLAAKAARRLRGESGY